MLSATDQLERRPHRILVAGTSGSGKTMLARRIASTLTIPHVEIDALFHGTGWEPRESFVADVEELAASPDWVTEWQYESVRALLLAAADLLVWLDLSRARVMWQVTRRTVNRRRRRETLWNDNVEPPLRTFFTDPEHIVRWAWRTHSDYETRVMTAAAERPELPVVRLTSHHAARAWTSGPLADVAPGRN